MLKPDEMSRMIITGPKNAQQNVVKALHRLKVIHIIEHSKTEFADIGEPFEAANSLSELIVKVRALIAALGIKKEETDAANAALPEISHAIKKLNEDLSKNTDELKKIDSLLSKYSALLRELKPLENINVPLEAFHPYRSLVFFAGYVSDSYDINYLKGRLSSATEKFAVFESDAGKKIFIVLFIDLKSREYAGEALQKIKFAPVSLSNIGSDKLNQKENAAVAIKKAESRIARLEKLKAAVNKRFERLARDHKGFLIASEEFLSRELEKAEAPLRFAATKGAFLIKGWVPTAQLNDTISMLNKASKNKAFIDSEPAGHESKVPVKLKNKGYAKPFEFFIDLYSTPNYREIDPTFFIFLTFPVFFGFMLGDIGYGLVSLISFYSLKKMMPKAAKLFNILIISSISSIVFGLVFGEFFGFEEIGHFEIPHLISRTHSMFGLMYIAIGIGMVHVNWGLIAGFINIFNEHGLKHAVFEKGGWFVLEIGVLLLALSLLGKIPLHWAAGAAFLLASLVMLYKGEGIRGLIEVPGILTNVLSYMRLAAIGLSSVYIAAVVNEMARGFFHEGGALIIAGILILLTGHVLNMLLGLFGSFLHSLRLHYVEFFSKFFNGGAEKYSPFGAKGE